MSLGVFFTQSKQNYYHVLAVGIPLSGVFYDPSLSQEKKYSSGSLKPILPLLDERALKNLCDQVNIKGGNILKVSNNKAYILEVA